MGTRVAIALAVVCIAIGVGYFSKVTYPDGCDYPFKVKLIYSVIKLHDAVGKVIEKFGWSYWTLMKLNMIRNKTVDNVQTDIKIMAGVEVTIHQPTDYTKKDPGAAMIYIHGGGWAVGSTASYSTYLKSMVRELGMLIITPEYRLAPEFPYPIPFQDSLRVTEEFLRVASSYNVNPKKIVLAGESAGGNLAMAVNLALIANSSKTGSSKQICMLNMIYPALQVTDLTLPSYIQNADPPMAAPPQMARAYLTYMGLEKHTELIEPLLNKAHMKDFELKEEFPHAMINERYIPSKYKERTSGIFHPAQLSHHQEQALTKFRKKLQEFASDPFFAPLIAKDDILRKLPATHLVSCEYDVLRDDSVLLYERMKTLGLQVSHQNLEFGAHGLINLYGLTDYERLNIEMDKMFNVIKNTVGRC